MGSPEFAVPSLEALINSPEHNVIAVYSQPPRPSGRGHKLTNTPIHQLAELYNIDVFTPKDFKNPDDVQKFQELDADIAVVAAYGLLLPKTILEALPKGCINIHPSKLPRWRGAAPIQHTILSGDKETAICIMQMDEGLDSGDVILQKDYDISDKNYTSGELHDFLSEESTSLLLESLNLIKNNSVTQTKQNPEDVTYASKISKKMSVVNWNKSAEEIDCLIRGLSPWPSASFEYKGEQIKIHKAEIIDLHGNAGEIIDDQMTIACNDKAIRCHVLQRPGKKAMAVEDFLRGFQKKL